MFLKISQYWQENTCVGVSFDKVAVLKVRNFVKKKLKCWRTKYFEIFKNIIFTEHLQQMFSQENICGGGLIWINFLQRVMRYDLFVGYDISRITDTYKKSFICILLKHGYIPHINNLLLIPDLFVRRMMTCLCRHYWLHDVLWRLNK